MTNARSERGFTIVEIVMVVVVIGLLAAFAVPKINITAYRINGGVRSVNGLLTRAQRLAVTNQFNTNVVFDVANSMVRIHEDDNNDNVADANERVRQYPIGENVEYGLGGAPVRTYGPGPVTFTRTQGALPVVIFRRDGSASENGAVYLTSLNSVATGRVSDARLIEIVRATGRTSWFRYTGTQWERKY